LLIQGWKDGVDVQLLPVWIRFNSFKKIPKEVDISFGAAFGKEIINATDEEGLKMQSINKETERQLLQLSTVVTEPVKNKFSLLLALPALLGFVTHVFLFLCVHFFAKSIKETIHYDSVIFSAIALLYPIYLLFTGCIVLFTAGWQWALLVLLLLPLLARSYTLWK
jgi:1-acyl-sn-glycerol-3-phosphate acyltransferase